MILLMLETELGYIKAKIAELAAEIGEEEPAPTSPFATLKTVTQD